MTKAKAIKRASEMALALSKNYTWNAYCELIDFCTDNEIDFFHDEEEGRIYVADDAFSII